MAAGDETCADGQLETTRATNASHQAHQPASQASEVAAIFLVLPRMSGVPDAYPVPSGFWDVLVVAVACGLVTAPIVWLHFGRVALWTVPANVAAEPAMPPLISLSLAAAAARARLLPQRATTRSAVASPARRRCSRAPSRARPARSGATRSAP